jgi:formate hydrogenlyase subunit 6/NADH:ubiquinone oxidoreductase subunit I
MRYPKLRELKEAIKAIIRGPYTRRFPFVKHIPFERFRGKSEFHQDDCVGCGACFQVCPAKAIDMEDGSGKRILTVHWDLCIFCGQCQANCLTGKGIMLSNEFDLATTEERRDLKQQIEKELVACDCCKEIIAPYDQILWVAKRLGTLCFSNVTLMLFYLHNLGLVIKEEIPIDEKQESTRSDRFKVLCPRCRREAVYKS